LIIYFEIFKNVITMIVIAIKRIIIKNEREKDKDEDEEKSQIL
jgi:hypothetical protein